MEKHQLDWISIEGFKSIANSGKIELRPINLVIGANGVGKSNFINAFLLAKAWNRISSYASQNGGANETLHFGSKNTTEINIHFSFYNGLNTFDQRVRSAPDDSLISVTHQTSHAYETELDHTTTWQHFHVHDTGATSALKRTNKTDDNDYLRPDGSNLAAFLYRLHMRFPNDYQMIVKTVQRIAPFFEDFLLRPDNLNPEYIKLAWTHKGTDKYFGASALSDGTLRFIALTTLLLQPLELRPSVILIDEPELGLHPKAIGLLAAMIHSASVNTQVIAATQSPILLDYFEPEDVLVAERLDNGTVFNRLHSQELQTWLDDYSLGQLWEKNYLGANP